MRTPDYLITYVETPSYLTTGKHYAIEEDFEDGALYSILDNENYPIIARAPGCAHLNGEIWKKGYIYYV